MLRKIKVYNDAIGRRASHILQFKKNFWSFQPILAQQKKCIWGSNRSCFLAIKRTGTDVLTRRQQTCSSYGNQVMSMLQELWIIPGGVCSMLPSYLTTRFTGKLFAKLSSALQKTHKYHILNKLHNKFANFKSSFDEANFRRAKKSAGNWKIFRDSRPLPPASLLLFPLLIYVGVTAWPSSKIQALRVLCFY